MNAEGRLKGKVAIVTGAASGIGLGIARLFAVEGASLVLTDVRQGEVERQLPGLKGNSHLALRLDVTQEDQWESTLNAANSKFGRVDILVNNAGIPAQGTIEETTLEQWRKVLAVNLDGVFLGCKHAIRSMKKTGGGVIVNVSSVGALKASLTGAAYGASKAGVWNLTRTVAASCARSGYNIRCNSLHPGLTRTPMMDQAPPEMIERLKAGIPLQRLGAPEDIARAALYLASDESTYVTGTSLVVDGGYLA